MLAEFKIRPRATAELHAPTSESDTIKLGLYTKEATSNTSAEMPPGFYFKPTSAIQKEFDAKVERVEQDYQQRIDDLKRDPKTGESYTAASISADALFWMFTLQRNARSLIDVSLERVKAETNADSMVTEKTHVIGELLYEHEVIPLQRDEAKALEDYNAKLEQWRRKYFQ